jgi:hypothetical protein
VCVFVNAMRIVIYAFVDVDALLLYMMIVWRTWLSNPKSAPGYNQESEWTYKRKISLMMCK